VGLMLVVPAVGVDERSDPCCELDESADHYHGASGDDDPARQIVMDTGPNGPQKADKHHPPAGLTEEEARRMAEQGQSNQVHEQASRTVADIVRSNLLTRFNALLGSMLVIILIVGPIQDSLFGLILIANMAIGIAQEIRAKLTLDRLAIVVAPTATVFRSGAVCRIPASGVVLGDLVEAEAGDEIVVDGVVESGEAVEINEALLSGEALPVAKKRGDPVLAGSFITSGRASYKATSVGESTYARRLTVEARRFQLVRSELMRGINLILRVVTWLIVPVSALLVYSQLRANPNLADAIRGSVAGVVTLIPEGLVLLTTASLALAILRLARHKVLVQQLPAVEVLARADVMCLDKTGTLTQSESALESVEPLAEGDSWRHALAAMARLDGRSDSELAAIRSAYPTDLDWTPSSTIAFSSGRRWSSAEFTKHGVWVLGAPDVLLQEAEENAGLQDAVAGHARFGRRVLLLGRADSPIAAGSIPKVAPQALIVLKEAIKADAAATLAQLASQGVAIKLISGDHPGTVAAIAASVGLATGAAAVDGRTLPEPGPELTRIALATNVFGRVSPEQKRHLVAALRSAHHTVAMVGDGVNDVLALKEADLGIAMGGGSGAARAVAALVLVDGSFAGVPQVVHEGRRVIENVGKLANLFFTKTVYAFLIAIAVGVVVLPFPFLPRQLTLVSLFTIGIPSVVLTFMTGAQRVQPGFLSRVLRFALPAGVVAAAASFSAYALAVADPAVSPSEERTTATVVVAAVGLWLLVRLVRPLGSGRRALIMTMAAGLLAAVVVPPFRAFFDLDLPRPTISLAALGIIALAILSLEAGDRVATLAARTISQAARFARFPP
jgi:cation-transporting ATPase E